jgi:hypothetical protein
MQTILMFTVALHVLSGIFWAGSTFVLARLGIWGLVHVNSFQPQEQILALGAGCAIIAAGVQGATAARMRLAHANAAQAPMQGSVTLPHRIAAALLAVTVICMASARYV